MNLRNMIKKSLLIYSILMADGYSFFSMADGGRWNRSILMADVYSTFVYSIFMADDRLEWNTLMVMISAIYNESLLNVFIRLEWELFSGRQNFIDDKPFDSVPIHSLAI